MLCYILYRLYSKILCQLSKSSMPKMGSILLLFFFFFFFFFIFPVFVQSQNTSFFFEGFYGASNNLTLELQASIMSNPRGVLKLTNKSNKVIGRAFYKKPIQMIDKASSPNVSSFSTSFVFEIVPPSSGSGGYGLAFLLAPSTQLPGAEPGHYLGILSNKNDGKSSNHIFMVEFDTVNGFNEGLDMQGNHVGIGLNRIFSDVSEPTSFYVNNTDHKEDFPLEGNGPIQAWIEYDGVQEVVNVTVSPTYKEKPVKPLISRKINLTGILKENMYAGFSASTGDKSSSHYILGWSFQLNEVAPSLHVSKLPRPPPKEKISTSYDGKTVALISSLCVVTVLLMGLLGFFLLHSREEDSEVLEDWEIDCPRRFRYKDLYVATDGFKESEVIGTGGFGSVYKGVLSTNGSEVAVKKITRNSLQGMREFAAEIESLGRLRHKNLVHLYGWCKKKNDLLLVYEYIPNGSLHSLLFKPKHGFVLNWEQRFNIIKGIASGLLYLHEEWEKVVIHRDVKSSNVLIDAELKARLGDFGLARLYDHGGMSQTTSVVGTIGYIAPELIRTGKASASSDVFAFGILLLEMATGRRPIGSSDLLLMEWVRDCQQLAQILDAADPSLNSSYSVKEMELVLTLGLICSHQRIEVRPTMRQVLRYLNGDDILPFVDDWGTADYSQQGSELGSRTFQISDGTFKTSHRSHQSYSYRSHHSYSSTGFTYSSMNSGR